MKSDYTDATYEFVRMVELLRGIKNQGVSQLHSVISANIKQSNNISYPIFRTYSAVHKRADDIVNFVKTVEDDFLDDETRNYAIGSINSVKQFFSEGHFLTPYDSSKNQLLTDSAVVSLKFLSRTDRAHRPLAKIEPDRIASLISSLDEATADLKNQKTLPAWALQPLLDGIIDLKFKLSNFVFFGHDESISNLLYLQASTEAISHALKKQDKPFNLGKLVTALLLAAEIFTVPADMANDVQTYKGWISSYRSSITPLLPPPRDTSEQNQPPTDA